MQLFPIAGPKDFLMPFILMALVPVAVLAAFVVWRWVLGRRPGRRTIDVWLAILLLGYFVATAGLGIF